MFLLWADRKRTRYVLTMAPVAGLLTAFWTLPFLFGGAYMTDMTYERRPVGNAPNGQPDSYWQMLFPYTAWIDRTVFVLAAIGLDRLRHPRPPSRACSSGSSRWCSGRGPASGRRATSGTPRLLPFMYLARYMLAFIGVYEIVGARRCGTSAWSCATARPGRRRPSSRRRWGRQADGLATPDRAVGARLDHPGRRRPGLARLRRQSTSSGACPSPATACTTGKTTYDWLFFRGTKSAFVDDWARWNYSGYEGKNTYGEYRSIMSTMKEIGQEQGCGRALWEHQTGDDVSSYGTPMALMLLPFFTDGCIGSMEGLYFEASGTTPYHFLTAAAGSKQASNPVRRLAYDNDDVDLAVRYMQDLGIRYYMAFRPEVVAQADANPDLTALRQVGPWTIYEVADSDLVVPLTTNPVVVKGVDAAALPLHLGRDAGPAGWSWAPAGSSTPRTGRRCRRPTARPTGSASQVKPPTGRRPTTGTWPGSSRSRPSSTSTLDPVEVSDVQTVGRLDLVLGRPGGRAGAGQGRATSRTGRSSGAEGPVPGGAQLHGRGADLQPGRR